MKKAHILYVDIEATNLSADMGYLLSIGYKWNYEKKPHVLRIDHTKEWKKNKTDDTGLLKAFEPIYDTADLVVHHFGRWYDIPFLQTRRLIKGLIKMPDVAQVDTWRICRQHLKFHSNRLDSVLKALKCPYSKTAVDGEKWIQAMAGMPKAIDYVVHHNKMDVLVLEWVYKRLAPLLPSHPTVTPYRHCCKSCGSSNLKGHGWRLAQSNWYQRLKCQQCGHTMKGDRAKL